MLCPFYISTHIHIHAYVCIFLVVPFFLQPLAVQSTYTHLHLGTRSHTRTTGAAAISAVTFVAAAQLKSNAFRLLRLIQFSYSYSPLCTQWHTHTICECTQLGELLLLRSYTRRAILKHHFRWFLVPTILTHTHSFVAAAVHVCVCVSVREQSAVCVCLPPLVVNALLPFHTFLLFFLSSIANHTVACFQLHLLLCDTCPLCRNKFTLLLTIASFCLQTFVCVCVSICCFELLLKWPDCK